MIVSSVRFPGVLLIRFSGIDALDTLSAVQAKTEAVALIDGTADVVVDLSGITFLDSTGIAVLVSLVKAARRKGRDAHFAAAGPEVRSVLAVIKLDRIFDLHPDVSSAAEAVKRMRDASAPCA
jgi:anti-sigma B factor antagonist